MKVVNNYQIHNFRRLFLCFDADSIKIENSLLVNSLTSVPELPLSPASFIATTLMLYIVPGDKPIRVAVGELTFNDALLELLVQVTRYDVALCEWLK